MRFVFGLCGTIVGLMAAFWASIALWGTLSPVVVLHYANDAAEPVVIFFNDNHSLTRELIQPGEAIRYPTAMFASPRSWIEVSTPYVNRNGVEIQGKFSRVDVCISAEAKFESEVRHSFFARFTEPSNPCSWRRPEQN